jgi:hypothetical protein
MMRLALVREEVLSRSQQLSAFHLNAKLFMKLSRNCMSCHFTCVNATAWNRPELITLQAVKQDMFVVNYKRSNAVVKAVRASAEGDHEASRVAKGRAEGASSDRRE